VDGDAAEGRRNRSEDQHVERIRRLWRMVRTHVVPNLGAVRMSAEGTLTTLS
jgi:hypothetical protein